jgi:uncharacterized membrane protein
MQILITVIIVQFIIICWLAYPRIKQHIDNNRY